MTRHYAHQRTDGAPMSQDSVQVTRLGFLGVRIADPARFMAAVSLYRDTLGLIPFRFEPGRLAWFRLGDGTELHVYGPEDRDHVAFGVRPCVGLVVDDVDATRREMENCGIEFLWETQRDGDRAWAHHRGPDGAVYELIGPSTPSQGMSASRHPW